MHDLLVDRGADARRKAIQSLETRRGTLVRADELLGDAIELHRRRACADRLANPLVRRREDLSARGHRLDLPRRLELYHQLSPTACRVRFVTSSIVPTASILAMFAPCDAYHAITGAVCS